MESALPVLLTARLELRPPSLDDADDLFAFDRRVLLRREARRFLHRPVPDDVAEVRERIEKATVPLEAGGTTLMWVVRPLPAVTDLGRSVCGFAAFVRWEQEHHRSEIAYAVDPGLWGRGIAVEATERILAFAGQRLGLHRAEAHIDPLNLASVRVAKKLGFVLEGTLHDHVMHAGRYADTAIYGKLFVA
jgi:ribosomal-protein-alanine N-acetyltransferase